MSNIIKSINPTVIVSSNNIPPRSGAFEIKLDDKLVYSKLNSGTFPNKTEIDQWFK